MKTHHSINKIQKIFLPYCTLSESVDLSKLLYFLPISPTPYSAPPSRSAGSSASAKYTTATAAVSGFATLSIVHPPAPPYLSLRIDYFLDCPSSWLSWSRSLQSVPLILLSLSGFFSPPAIGSSSPSSPVSWCFCSGICRLGPLAPALHYDVDRVVCEGHICLFIIYNPSRKDVDKS